MAIISANLSFNRGAHELLDFSSLQVKYSTALAWAQDANSNAAVGQYIYLQESETINNVVYPKGPYVVEGIGENAYIHYLLGGDGKADADDVYTKEEINAALAKYVTNEVFNNYKQEVTDALAEKLVANDLAEYAKSADVVAKEGYVAYSEKEKTKLSNIEEKAQVNVIEKVTLFGNEVVADENKVVAIDFQSDDIKLGVDITTTVTDEETGESSEVVVFGSDKTISETLKGIYSSLQAGLSGGVTSVTAADDSVIVSGDVNNKEVKVQISAAADNRLSVRTVDGEKGLYVEPLYYMGDDSEVE